MLEQLKNINELSNIKDKEIFYEGDFNKQDAVKLFTELKNNEAYSFDQLIDITAVDYPYKEKRFEIIYILLSMKKK